MDIPFGRDYPDVPWPDGELTANVGRQVISFVRLSDVEPERVTWLWPRRIPVGKLVVLDGDPDLGKSTLALAIGATITRGGLWPDGTSCDYPGAVVLFSGEDGLADTVRPRADVAGADVSRIISMKGIGVVDESGATGMRPPTLADIAALEHIIVKESARLVVVDVLMQFLPTGTNSHKDQDIRQVLSRLSELANRTGCTVLLLRHLNKDSSKDALYRGGGSIGIVGAARAGLLVAPDPDDRDLRVLAMTKSNLARKPDSITYRLVEMDALGVARIEWQGTSSRTAADLLGDTSGQSEAEQWLADYMAEQVTVQSKTAKADAARAGIPERSLQRAAKSLGLRVGSRGFPRVTWWELHSHDTDALPPNTGATGATADDQQETADETGQNPQSRHDRGTGATDDEDDEDEDMQTVLDYRDARQ